MNTTTLQEPVVQAATQPITWKADPAHTSVQFTVRHMMFAEVTGKFREFEFTATQQGDDFANSKINASIKAESITTDVANRDAHLRSADFFDVENHPSLTFTNTSFIKTGENTYKIDGNLTIRGVTKPIELTATYLGQAVDPWGNLKTGFKVTGRLNRYDYGLQWNQALEAGGILVSKEVDITIIAQLIKAQ